jgi:hypothetical protein
VLFDAFLGALEAEVSQPVAPVAVQANAATVTATR